MPKFQFSGGGGKLEKLQSAKISLSFNFGGGGILQMKSQSANISDNFHSGGGGGILQLKSQSAKISDNFHFRGGGGGILYCRIGVNCRIWTKFSTTPAGSCITDSLSHTTYVETNEYLTNVKDAVQYLKLIGNHYGYSDTFTNFKIAYNES